MALPNAYAQYSNNKVLTASPAELVLMLYDGAIKFCNIAVVAIDAKDIPKAHTNIVKAQKIIDHLRITLDMSYPVAQDFDNIYAYVAKRLVEANVSRIRRYWKRYVLTYVLSGIPGKRLCVLIMWEVLHD